MLKNKNIIFSFNRVKKKEIVTFTRELSILHKAGLSLIRSLNSLREQMKEGKFRQAINDVVEGIERGDTFSDSLAQHPEIFPKLYVNMVKSGELGGELDTVLKRLSILLEKEERLKKKIKAALIYPIFVLSIAVIILSLLMIIVIPTFTEIFADLGGELPAPTRFLISVSNFFTHYWYYLIAGVFVFVQGIQVALKYDNIKYYFDKASLMVPVFGKLIRNVSISSFCRTLGTLLNSGVNIISALQIVHETQENLVFARVVPGFIQHVKEGESLAILIENAKVFPNLVVKMVAVGEETGELSDMLVQVSDNYEEEVDLIVGSLASLIEPILIVIMGLIVGFIVISMFLPLFNITDLI